GPSEGLRGHFVVAPEFTAKLDDDCVHVVKPLDTPAIFDDVDNGLRYALFQGLGLMGDPFELAVHLARRYQDRDFACARRKTCFETQVLVDSRDVRCDLRAVELDTGGAPQAGDGPARGDGAVVGVAPRLVQILTPGQRQPKSRLWIDVGRHV